MSHTHVLNALQSSFVAALIVAIVFVASFFTLEPKVGRAISSNFTVSQQITNEISFVATSSATTMIGSIAGLTGGYATGTNVTVVNTNNATGYNMTLYFSTTTAMRASSTAWIDNYLPVASGTPDYDWLNHTSGQSAQFGYTVRASTTGEVAAAFRNNGSACNAGATETEDKCWMNPATSTAAVTIINSNAPSTNSTTTIKFKVAVPSNPSPALPSGFYYATGTLTATVNP